MNSIELQFRLKSFAYKIVKFCEALPKKRIAVVIENQILRSAFSAAANYRAATNAQSSKSFVSQLSIAFEEINESLFWLENINDLKLIKEEKLLSIQKSRRVSSNIGFSSKDITN